MRAVMKDTGDEQAVIDILQSSIKSILGLGNVETKGHHKNIIHAFCEGLPDIDDESADALKATLTIAGVPLPDGTDASHDAPAMCLCKAMMAQADLVEVVQRMTTWMSNPVRKRMTLSALATKPDATLDKICNTIEPPLDTSSLGSDLFEIMKEALSQLDKKPREGQVPVRKRRRMPPSFTSASSSSRAALPTSAPTTKHVPAIGARLAANAVRIPLTKTTLKAFQQPILSGQRVDLNVVILYSSPLCSDQDRSY
jgi:hypothetical protein